jgi:hypothetical protein
MANTAPNEPATSCGFQGANRRAMVRFRCAPPSPGSAFFANSSTSVRAHVVNVTPLPDGTWRCGCAFLSRLAEEELKVLLR